MPNTREKLVEIIQDAYSQNPYVVADNLIANGVTVQEWIPASEPPKDDTEDFWVIYKTGAGYRYTTGYFDGRCWRSSATSFEIPVVGWMPLPEPPKGE